MITNSRRAGRAGRGDERGYTVDALVVVPALLFVIMLIIQFSLYAHATAVAQAAAQDGAAAARRIDGTVAAAKSSAEQTINQSAGNIFSSSNVVATRNATQANVVVTGNVVSLLPGFTWSVRETATGPVERYAPQAAP